MIISRKTDDADVTNLVAKALEVAVEFVEGAGLFEPDIQFLVAGQGVGQLAAGIADRTIIVIRSKCVWLMNALTPLLSRPKESSAIAASYCFVSKFRPESSATRSCDH
jgi:hypothetical protein